MPRRENMVYGSVTILYRIGLTTVQSHLLNISTPTPPFAYVSRKLVRSGHTQSGR